MIAFCGTFFPPISLIYRRLKQIINEHILLNSFRNTTTNAPTYMIILLQIITRAGQMQICMCALTLTRTDSLASSRSRDDITVHSSFITKINDVTLKQHTKSSKITGVFRVSPRAPCNDSATPAARPRFAASGTRSSDRPCLANLLSNPVNSVLKAARD